MLSRFERFSAAVKPGYLLFYRHARNWIRRAVGEGRSWDVVHQVAPLAMRYPSPAVGLAAPLVLGPLAGSVPTPSGFRKEFGGEPWYMRLRNLDRWRIRFDPWIRRTYRNAALIIGVAPYVEATLRPCTNRPFRFISETGPRDIALDADRIWAERRSDHGPVRFLYVGRIVRSKGLRDAIRAFQLLGSRADIQLDILGDGPDRAECERAAASDGRIRFHGRVPRVDVDEWYRKAQVFLFPSFREPSGNVVFEAMGFALPMIVADAGGPGFTVDDDCGVKIAITDPQRFAGDISHAVEALADDAALRERQGRAAFERVAEVGAWDRRIKRLEEAYSLVTLGGGS